VTNSLAYNNEALFTVWGASLKERLSTVDLFVLTSLD